MKKQGLCLYCKKPTKPFVHGGYRIYCNDKCRKADRMSISYPEDLQKIKNNNKI